MKNEDERKDSMEVKEMTESEEKEMREKKKRE